MLMEMPGMVKGRVIQECAMLELAPIQRVCRCSETEHSLALAIFFIGPNHHANALLSNVWPFLLYKVSIVHII